MNPTQPITKIVDKSTVENIFYTRKVIQDLDITENQTLLSYLPGPDKDITEQFEIDPTLNKDINKTDNVTLVKNISIPIAAAVTAYARIYITKIKLDILKRGGKIYYSDTDSIITDIELNPNLVDPKVIGKFKLEHELELALMPAPKVYFLKKKDIYNTIKDEDQKYIVKAKGGSSKDLLLQQFEDMILGNSMEINKRSSKTNWVDGTVIISDQTITLDPNSYISRDKIYDSNHTWINTSPTRIVE